MKLSVFALDYDGTIARHDRLEPSVREAIADARSRGIVTLIVTGRILSELERVAGALHFVDGVVAENGAVLHFPDSGHTTLLAPTVSRAFLDELQRRSIAHVAGKCVVDADADDAPRLLEVIRALELPLVLIFNGGRVMVLPQGVSKATGLHAALDTLRLSARNSVAVGDRENDHELLRLVEVGAAVEWGSGALRAAADVVIAGSGPAAVAAYVRDVGRTGLLPVPPRARRTLHLGHLDDGREFALAVRGRNVLVAGDAKSGKSWIAGMLCEQLIQHGYSVCVIDPEGDYRSLEGLPGVTVLGGEDPPPTARALHRALEYPDRSVVIDLSHQEHDTKIAYIRTVLPALKAMRRRTGLPHRILVDEAHYFLHESDADTLLDLAQNGYIIVTYCASRLPKALLDATEVIIVTCESNPDEIGALFERCVGCGRGDRARWAMLSHLRAGQAVALPVTEESGGDLRLFTMGPRLTPHVRHREKYVDMPVTEQRAFVFGGIDAGRRQARTLREFVTELSGSPVTELEPFVRRGDFSRWIRDVFGDHALAAELRRLEMHHRQMPGAETVPEMVEAIRARYDVTEQSDPDPQGQPDAIGASEPA